MSIRKHLKWIIPVALLSTGALAGTAFICVLSRNAAPVKYSAEWIRNLSDVEWQQEREIVRLQFCSAGNSAEGGMLQSLLWLFDSIKREKMGPVTGSMYPRSREHGWNLYKPD